MGSYHGESCETLNGNCFPVLIGILFRYFFKRKNFSLRMQLNNGRFVKYLRMKTSDTNTSCFDDYMDFSIMSLQRSFFFLVSLKFIFNLICKEHLMV